MKQSILHFSFLLAFIAASIPCLAQITVEREDFTRMQGFIDSTVRAIPVGIIVPDEGPDQLWDYSSLQYSELLETELFSAAGDANYPNALNYMENDLFFQGFTIPAFLYEAVDDQGWHYPGYVYTDVIFPLGAVTGGVNDSIRFVGGPSAFDGRQDILQFPMTYLDEWEQTNSISINFELSVAAFGLNKVPGFRKQINTQQRKVVGYGKVIIPDRDGSPSEPVDVLMIKSVFSSVDSFFLGGAPAPPPLTAAFGLVQGATTVDSFYVFYRKDFGEPILNINLPSSSGGLSAFYTPGGLDVVSSVRSPVLMDVKHFPNPVAAGGVLTIQTEAAISAGWISFSDITGRIIHQINFEQTLNNQMKINVPTQIPSGLYFYQIHNKQGILTHTGKVVVE